MKHQQEVLEILLESNYLLQQILSTTKAPLFTTPSIA
jgi:hypothetical protein